MSITGDDNRGKEGEFSEFDKSFRKRSEASAPSVDTIESQFLTADKEDRAKGFDAKKNERYLQQLAAEFFENIELELEKPFAPRVKVNQGRLKVVWRDIEGRSRTDDATEMSMNGIKFRSANFVPSAVKQLIFPISGKTITIKRAEYVTQEKGQAIFHLLEFENESDDWMTWIEYMSRINEEF